MSQPFPVVEHYVADPPPELMKRAEIHAGMLLQMHPELVVDVQIAPLQATAIDDAPLLHLDDQTNTPMLETSRDIRFRQDMARLRAGDGDLVAACIAPVKGFEVYCNEYLGLGSVCWLQPFDPRDHQQVAVELWRDPETRRVLVETARHSGRLRIDPYKGNRSVWQLANLIQRATQSDVSVIAPHPGLAAWVNNKLEFSRTVQALFTSRFMPRTLRAGNLAKAAQLVRRLANTSERIVLKLPDSVGGGGNVPLAARPFRDGSLSAVRDALRNVFCDACWDGECELLVGEWETEVLAAPSVQIWIPPGEPKPVVEGLFEQTFADEHGMYEGSRPAMLPSELQQLIVDHSWILAWLLQRLGYVGRCSFDMLITTGGDCPQPKFLECNGRWGAASMPMTLMNRLFGDWARQPYIFNEYENLGLERVTFRQLLRSLESELYDVRTGRGRWILANPARMAARGGISVISLLDPLKVSEASMDETLREFRTTVSQVLRSGSDNP